MMDSIVSALRNNIEGLRSSKITERKKSVQALRELLDREEVIKNINEISSTNNYSEYSWDSLFSASHQALLIETDRHRDNDKVKSQSARENNKIQYVSLVSVIVKEANADHPQLHCNTIIDAVIYVLENLKYRNAIGDTYLNIFYQNLLPISQYWGSIKLTNWIALYNLGVNLFESPTAQFKSSTIIAMIGLIIKYGCEHSSLAVEIKQKGIFGFLKKVVQKSMEENMDFQCQVLRLLVITCEKLRNECRNAICKFSEEIFDKILDMCQTKVEGAEKKKQCFVDFLLIAIECHHPNGVHVSSEKSYAYNLENWNKRLRQLNHFANTELECARQKYAKSKNLPEKFVRVVVEVYNQILDFDKTFIDVTVNQTVNESLIDADQSYGRKRRRITCGLTDLIHRLNSFTQPADMWPWLSVISSLLSTYPAIVNDNEYLPLLQNVSKFLSSCKDPMVTDYLCQCCISLIKVRRKGILKEEELQDDEVWDLIWNSGLRTVGLNQNIEWSHKLLQHMMEFMWNPARGQSILKLYLSNVIRLSKSSLLTLYYLRLHLVFPTVVLDVPVHSTLIRWLLPVLSENSSGNYFLLDLPVEYEAHVILLSCLKNNSKKIPETLNVLKVDLRNRSCITPSEVYSLTSYDSKIFVPSNDIKSVDDAEDTMKSCVTNDDAFEVLQNFVEDQSQSLLNICSTSTDKLTVVHYLSSYALFLIHILRFAGYYDLGYNTSRLNIVLERTLDELFKITNGVLETSRNIGVLYKLLCHVSILFQQLGIIPPNLVESAVDKFYLQLRYVFECLETPERTVGKSKRNGDDEIDDEFLTNINTFKLETFAALGLPKDSFFCIKTLLEIDLLRMQALRLLIYYSFNHGRLHVKQYNIIERVLEVMSELLEAKSNHTLFIMSAFSIKAALLLNDIDDNLLSKAVSCLRNTCAAGEGEWCLIEESALSILHLIEYAVAVTRATKKFDEWYNLKVLINGMRTLVQDSGAQITSQIVKCLGSFLEINVNNLSNGCENLHEILLESCLDLMQYLKNPFHEVRVTAMFFIAKIFTIIDHFNWTIQFEEDILRIIDRFETVLNDLFIVDKITEEEIDETVNRPLTVFYSLANAICSSRKYRRKFISMLFFLTYEKQLKQVVAAKILELIKFQLNVEDLNGFIKQNLAFILSIWYKKYKSFENFPFRIIGCRTIQDFYKQYLTEIVVEFSFATNVNRLKEISEFLKISLVDIFKQCFPEVLAIVLKKIIESRNDPSNSATRKIYDFFINTLTQDGFETMTLRQLANVLTSIFRNLHDDNFEIPANSILPNPTPYVSDVELIKSSIHYLQISAGANDDLLVYIAKNHPKFMPKIFLYLYIDVIKSTTPEIRLESLQKYLLFCHMLLPHYKELAIHKMAAFIAHNIIYNLLNFVTLRAADTSFMKTTLKFFLKFAKEWLSGDKSHQDAIDVFAMCLGVIVEKLIVLSLQHSEMIAVTLNVLNYLLNDRIDVLFASIKKLDQFPEQPEFRCLREGYLEMDLTESLDSPLANEVASFLNTSENSSYSPCRLESLRHLRKRLISNKNELIDMFKHCAVNNLLSEEYVHNMPHRLICTLVEHTRFKNEEVRYEAVNCLSEIGLVDLNTLVLKSSYREDNTSSPKSQITETVITILKECIVDTNVDVVKAATKVLLMTLSSKEGYQFMEDTVNGLDKSILFPFAPFKAEQKTKIDIWRTFSVEIFRERVENDVLWCPIDDPPYSTWIKNIVCAMCDSFNNSCFVNAMQTICQLKFSVAEKLFKYLVNLLASYENSIPIRIVSNCMNHFLENYFVSGEQENYYSFEQYSGKKGNECVYIDTSSIQCLLDVANFVRLNQNEIISDNFTIHCLLIARAALQCSAYYTAVLYTELHINHLIKSSDVPYDGNVLEFLEEIELQDDIFNILREAYSKIGDTEALYGCGSSLLLHPESRILHYQQTENWQRVFESCNTSLTFNPLHNGRINDLTSAIENSGYNYLQSQYLKSMNQITSQLKEAQYQSAWKLDKWDLVEPPDNEKTFSYFQYAALKDIHMNNYNGVRISIECARKALIPSIAHINLECTKNIYPLLAKLQCLQDIENFVCINDLNAIITEWKIRSKLCKRLEFNHEEAILNARVHLVDKNNEQAQEFILCVAKKARKERNFVFAANCLSMLRDKNIKCNDLLVFKVQFEEACVLWDQRETYIARYLLKDLLKRDETLVSITFRATLLRTYGRWLSQTNLENADTIFDKYFLPSSELIPKREDESAKERKIRLKTYKRVAEFADMQYQQICEYVKSDTFEEQIKTVSESKKKSDALSITGEDSKKSKIQLANQSKIEDTEVKGIMNKRHRYLILALKYYLKVLAESEKEDLKIFRIVSFWLDQKSNIDLHKELNEMVFEIPSYKFIPVLPQLMAHVTRDTTQNFGKILSKLIIKCATEHPHHTMPLIFALSNYTKDDKYDKNPEKTCISREKKSSEQERVFAASDLIKQLRIVCSADIIEKMEYLCEAYIEFAYLQYPGRSNSESNIPPQLQISKIVNYDNVFCPTITVPIDKRGSYDDVIGIQYIENNFLKLCGVNAPKKIRCLCTDGKFRDQLIKGKDDMRVDAVMQQVFTIMNKLLRDNKRTFKRGLLLRTYKIMPLSQRSGVLEFCTNTMSLGDYLCDRKVYESKPTIIGAHRRLRPQDISTLDARQKMHDVRNTKDEVKLATYEKICQQIKPVFRYFFIEKFRLPSMWFERKLAYIHSIATTSMVGYILGIGDRHVQNMLVDQKTAEIIHIDFGISFDQGLTLNCPELVPFRLTRDMEDGMGVFSIDGIFRRCCEQVMAVLRANSEIIRTTSEVFIHDPLYIWTVSTEKKASLQKNYESTKTGPEINITASRALSRLKLKLQGMEDGTPTNVEGQVNRLIQQAKNVHNLCKIFSGWQPYL